jgi:hypothetical protein
LRCSLPAAQAKKTAAQVACTGGRFQGSVRQEMADLMSVGLAVSCSGWHLQALHQAELQHMIL